VAEFDRARHVRTLIPAGLAGCGVLVIVVLMSSSSGPGKYLVLGLLLLIAVVLGAALFRELKNGGADSN
jgi:RecA-family ATPase